MAAGIDKKQDMCYIMFNTLKDIYTLSQQLGDILYTYYWRFQFTINIANMLHVMVSLHEGIINVEDANGRYYAQLKKTHKRSIKPRSSL